MVDVMEAGSIKAIDKGSVHRICSGQVVLTLATAVKELVENSIDAGASTVDVKLKEYGSEQIEVSDNGSGVEEKNFEGLTLKHHTSKLEDFSDLINVETFGFRGEALSSLCALSDLWIVTRHKNVEVGTRIEYDHHGKMTNKISVARQVGTTTTLQNLFYTLPVRHKEFHRNLKKEFVKMVQVLNAYCIINTGVRITCTNQTGKGNRTTVVSSKGNLTMKDNISNIFGPKQVQSLLEFIQCKPTEEVLLDYGVKCADSQTEMFKIEGYVSKCEHGQGRSNGDRQFYFINKRPCDHSKLSKLVNEVYHQYNRHQYPFVSLSITMQKESVDVNVTPDKRQIFLENEKIFLAVMKTSLVKMFEPTVSVYNVNTLDSQGSFSKISSFQDRNSIDDSENESSPVVSKPSITSALNILKRSFSSSFSKEEEESTVRNQQNKQRKLDNFVVQSKISVDKEEHEEVSAIISGTSDFNTSVVFETEESLKLKTDTTCGSQDFFIIDNEKRDLKSIDSESGVSSQDTTSSQSSISCITISSQSDSDVICISHESVENHSQDIEKEKETKFNPLIGNNSNESQRYKIVNLCSDTTDCVQNSNKSDRTSTNITDSVKVDEIDGSIDGSCVLTSEVCYPVDGKNRTDKDPVQNNELQDRLQITCFDEKQDQKRAEKVVKFDFRSFRDKVKIRNTKSKSGESFCRTFRAKISPTDNKSAEEELQKEIKKDMFSEMEILGQFNLGFIITKFNEDLFIVDQHATDEKYNFEMLQRHTVIQSQKLIHPQNLELTSSNEIILMENIDVFRKNGFDFIVDEEGEPTQRVKLISTPVSKNWTFGKDDIEELIFMLTDSPGVMCRPTRVRQMFASRACRKSIMIGTALNKTEMKKLVDHMGHIDQPWNCPHGRPTMRHLININMVPR